MFKEVNIITIYAQSLNHVYFKQFTLVCYNLLEIGNCYLYSIIIK